MERVHLVHRQEVDVALDERDGEEMSADVEVHAPVAEARLVLDGDGGHLPHALGARAAALAPQQLGERL